MLDDSSPTSTLQLTASKFQPPPILLAPPVALSASLLLRTTGEGAGDPKRVSVEQRLGDRSSRRSAGDILSHTEDGVCPRQAFS